MLLIRPASLQDFEAICAIATGQCHRYDKVRISRERLRKSVHTSIVSASHFAYVAEHDKEIVGVLIGITTENLWAQKQNCGLVLWVSNLAGAGAQLMYRFKAWLKPRRGIRIAGIAPDFDMDEKVYLIMERMGFVRQGGSYFLYN